MRKIVISLGLVSALAFVVGCTPATAADPTATPTSTPLAEATPTPTPQAVSGYDQFISLAGYWEGSWTNNTFGTTGKLTANISINKDGTASFTTDVGGLFFGQINPLLKTYTGTFDADVITLQAENDNLLGDVEITFSAAGQFHFAGTDMPVLGFQSVAAEGTITPEKMRGTYTVNFSTGIPAQGIFELLKELIALLHKV